MPIYSYIVFHMPLSVVFGPVCCVHPFWLWAVGTARWGLQHVLVLGAPCAMCGRGLAAKRMEWDGVMGIEGVQVPGPRGWCLAPSSLGGPLG